MAVVARTSANRSPTETLAARDENERRRALRSNEMTKPIAYSPLNTCLYRRHTPALIREDRFGLHRLPAQAAGRCSLRNIAWAILSFSLLRSLAHSVLRFLINHNLVRKLGWCAGRSKRITRVQCALTHEGLRARRVFVNARAHTDAISGARFCTLGRAPNKLSPISGNHHSRPRCVLPHLPLS